MLNNINIFEEILKSMAEDVEKDKIEPIILKEKTIGSGDNIFQILMIDSLSMTKILGKIRDSGMDMVVITELLLKYCTKGLDVDKFLRESNVGELNRLIDQINKLNEAGKQ